MAANSPTQLPAYIQLRYEENGVFDKLAGAGEEAARRTEQSFNKAFRETEKVVSGAVGRIQSKFSTLDLGVGDMRQQSVQIKQYRDALSLVATTAEQLARETGDTTKATQTYITALRSQAGEAGRVLQANEAQIASYSRLQAAIDRASTGRRPDQRSGVQRLLAGDASIDKAAVSGRTLEQVLGRVANKGREVTQALQEAARAAALAAQSASPVMANSGPSNLNSGVSALLAGQASIDRAAVSGTTLEQVLGRVASKSAAVTQAQNALAVSAARAAADQSALAAAVDRMNAELDPAVAATQRYAAQVKLLDDALAQGAISEKRHAEMLNLVNNASYTGTTATKNLVNSQRSFNIAMLQSGQQLQDIGVSLYSGQKAAVVFAQQLPQLAFALTFLEGSANKTQDRIGRFATFLSGPWGLAVGVAVGALGYLIHDLITAGDESDKSSKKTLTLTDALGKMSDATKEARKALDDYNDAQDQARKNSDSMIKLNLAEAQSQLDKAKATRETLAAELALWKQRESNPAFTSNLGAAGLTSGRALSGVDALIKANNEDINRLQKTVINRTIDDAKRDAAGAADPIKKINNLYDDMAAAAERAAAGNVALSKALKGTLTDIEKRRAAALEAQRESKRSSRQGSGLFGAEVDLAGAKSIAASAGFRVTSGLRTRAEQQRLYDTVRTPTNPVALPGTSAHEKGNALDIAFGKGVTAQSIKKAYADAGVRLTKLLKEDGHFHIEWSTKGADKAQREADAMVKKQQELIEFGQRASDAIASINGRFADQPRLISRTEDATRDLDAIIADLQNRQPPGFEKLIEDAKAAKETVQDALVRPYRELTRDSERRLQIQGLLSAGQDDEADALQEVWRMTDLVGDLTQEQADYVRNVVLHEKERTRELQRQQALFNAQLDVLDDVKQGLTDILSGNGQTSGKGFLKNIQSSLKELQGKRMFDSIFGDIFADIERELRGQSPLGKESQSLADELHIATMAIPEFTAALKTAANDNTALTAGSPSFNSAFADLLGGGDSASTGTDIVVTAKKPISIEQQSIQSIADKIAGGIVDPFQAVLSKVLGTRFGQQVGGVVKGALSGYLTGGATGGVLGGLKGIVDKTGIFGGSAGGLSGKLGQAGAGAAMGTQIAGITQALGLKTSTTGSQIGGAIGSFIPIPGGDIIGSIAGGILGGLLKKSRSAGATITQDGVTIGGKDKKNYETASGLGDSVTGGLKNIVDQLGGTLGNFAVTIGTRGKDYRVNTSGSSLKVKNGAVDFGDDQEAAIKYAIMDAINDGAVAGIRESTKNILKAGDDLDAALQDALDWENIFKELKQYKDPLGAAMDDLNKEFEHYIELAKTAGASSQEMADLEELYGIKRNEIIKEQNEKLIGSLQDLYDSLTIGDSGLSLRDRRANALTDYNALAARVAAGDTTAYNDYADAAKTVLDIERELYGSQQEYFDRLNEVTNLSKSTIDAANAATSAVEDSDSPFDSTGAVKTSIDSQTDVINSQLTAVNDNLGTMNAYLQSLGLKISSTSRISMASSF